MFQAASASISLCIYTVLFGAKDSKKKISLICFVRRNICKLKEREGRGRGVGGMFSPSWSCIHRPCFVLPDLSFDGRRQSCMSRCTTYADFPSVEMVRRSVGVSTTVLVCRFFKMLLARYFYYVRSRTFTARRQTNDDQAKCLTLIRPTSTSSWATRRLTVEFTYSTFRLVHPADRRWVFCVVRVFCTSWFSHHRPFFLLLYSRLASSSCSLVSSIPTAAARQRERRFEERESVKRRRRLDCLWVDYERDSF